MYINQVDLLFDAVAELILLLPKDRIYQLVEKNPQILTLLVNPPEDVINIALKKEPDLIEFVDNPDPDLIKYALKKNPDLIQFIKNPDIETALRLVKIDIDKYLPMINNKDQNFYNRMIEMNHRNIKYIPNEFINENILSKVVNANPDILDVLTSEQQSEELCLNAVSIKGRSLRFVKNQTFNIILTAINNDVNAFKYLDEKILTQEQLEEIRTLMHTKKADLLNV